MGMAAAGEWDPSMLSQEIEQVRKAYDEHCQVDPNKISPKLTFEYSCLLICSPSKVQVREGLELLLDSGYKRPEVLHHLVLTHLKLGQYVRAKEMVDMWLCLEPRNNMARMLHSLVLDRASHDGLIGILGFGVLAL